MKITPEELMHVARLARLEIHADAVDGLARQVATVLDYVDTLGQVDTEGVPATAHAIDLTNAFREDRLHDHISPEQALANAPQKAEAGFVVPKVIGGKALTGVQLRDLVRKGRTRAIRGLRDGARDRFDAYLRIDPNWQIVVVSSPEAPEPG